MALATTKLTAQGTDEALPAAGPPQAGQSSQNSKASDPAGPAFGSSDLKASSIIGLAVRNETGVRLGKVQDLIVSMNSHSVPFAIVEYGGALGIGQTRVAVLLTALKWSSESKDMILTATKDEFESASTAPTGGWMAVAGEDWLKNVDRFYGQPSLTGQSRYERQETSGTVEGREMVRNPAERKAATDLLNQPPASSQDSTTPTTGLTNDYVTSKVNALIRQNLGAGARDIRVTVKNGLVTLQGKIANEKQKQALENQIKALAGVDRVEDQLGISPE